MLPKSQPLDRYKAQFESLDKTTQEVIIKMQEKYPSYWWNPDSKCVCKNHKKVHQFSFEAYVEGWVCGYFGFDTVEKMQKSLGERR